MRESLKKRHGTLGARSGRAANLNQAFGSHLLKKFQQVGFVAPGVDVVLFQQHVPELADRPRLLQQAPDTGSHGIQAVIHGVVQIEDRGLIAQRAGYLLGRRADD